VDEGWWVVVRRRGRAYFGQPKSEPIDVDRIAAEFLTISKLWRQPDHVALARLAQQLDELEGKVKAAASRGQTG